MTGDPLPVLVSGIGGSGFGEQITKALRLAGKTRYEIVGCDASEYCAQYSFVDHAVVLPRADAQNYIDALLTVCRHYNVKAVFPGSEPELKVVRQHRAIFQSEGILLPINPDSLIDICVDKVKTSHFLETNGFHSPRYKKLSGTDDISEIDWYPVVVKPPVGSGGSSNCYIAQSEQELEKLLAYLACFSDIGNFMVQEYVGTPEEEYTVGVLFDMEGNFVNSIALRRDLKSRLNVSTRVRNLTTRAELGPSLVISSGVSNGTFGPFSEVLTTCERLATRLGGRSALNIQCRVMNGKVYVFEINPRFSGTTSLRAMVGYNEPDTLLRHHLMGEPLQPRPSYRYGTILRSLAEYAIPDAPAPHWYELSE